LKKTKIAKSRIITFITTLWVKRSGLILGLALFIFACEDPSELGLDLNPENGVFVAKFHDIPLGNSVLLYEDILSDNTTRIDSLDNLTSGGRLLTGTFANQNFGNAQSRSFASLKLGSVGFSNDTLNFMFDSLIFNIKVDYLYGNSILGNKRIYIHELTESLKSDTLYVTRNSTSYNDIPVGEFNFDLSVLDTVWIDTVITTRLSDELGMRFLEEATVNDTTFWNNDEFGKFFNGFAFISDDINDMITGIIPENPSTYLRMHFHNANDTSFLDFIFQDLDTIGGNSTKYYNNITLDRSGTPLEGITEYYTEFQTNNDLSYIQASTGVFTKINLQPYLEFLDTIDHLVINRAEIEIPVDTYTKNTIPSSPLDLYVIDQENRFKEEFVATRPHPIYPTVGRLSFVKDKNENMGIYVGTLTGFVQDITSGESADTLLLLGQPGLYNSVLSTNQTVIIKEGISLKVYYSTIQ